MLFGFPVCQDAGRKEKREEEALKNIKDAIQGYLETVEELSKGKESRYVEVNYA